MKKNLSEELIINDDIELSDNEELKADLDKEKDKLEKEVNKELSDKVKDIKEINEYEADKPQVNNGNGKSVKIKGLTEDHKLILEEPSDTLNESDDLNEKIPADLAKQYKRYGYSGAAQDTDLENATYDEISPEEAYKIWKTDPTSLRLMLDGSFIDFRQSGWPSLNHRNEYVSDRYAYVKKNGQKVRDTLHLPIKHLLKVADKIYHTNEAQPEGRKDPDLVNARRQNPESKNFYNNDYIDNHGLTGRWRDQRRGSISHRTNSNLDYYKRRKAEKEERLKRAIENNDEYRIQQYKDDLKDINDTIAQYNQENKDNQARTRYADSEHSLQAPFRRYKELKSNIDSLKNTVARRENELNRVKEQGSPEARENRSELNRLNDRLKDIKRQIALLEIKLEATDEEDAKAIANAEAQYTQAMTNFVNAQGELNQLLRRQ